MMWHSPIFDDEEGQHCKSTGSLCECNGNSVHTYDPPLVFDIAADPGESHPLSPTSPEHATATQFVQVRACERAKPTVPMSCMRVGATQRDIMTVMTLLWSLVRRRR